MYQSIEELLKLDTLMNTGSKNISKKDKKRILLEKVYEVGIPDTFRKRLEDNQVLLDFENYSSQDIKDLNYLTRELKYEISNNLSNILGIGNYRNSDTKFGKQRFTLTQDMKDWKKGWVDNSYDYFSDPNDFKNSQKIPYMRKNNELSECISRHYCSRFKSFRCNSKVFRDIITRGSSECQIIMFDDDKKNLDWKSHKDYPIMRYIYCKNNVVGFSQKLNSNILWIDIDKDDNNEIFKSFMKLMNNPKILYFEKSRYSKGSHLVLKYDENIPDEYRDKLQKFCRDNGVRIECCFYKHFLQLFGSIDYSPLYMEHYEKTGEFIYYNQLKLIHLLCVYERLLQRSTNPYYINSTKELYDIMDNKFHGLLVDEEPIKEEPIKEEEQPRKHNWDIINNNPVRFMRYKNYQPSVKGKQFQECEKGNKFKGLMNNVSTCYSMGISDLDTIKSYIRKYKGTSQTVSDVSDKDILRVLGYCKPSDKEKVKSILTNGKSSNIEFVSNLHLLSDDLKKYISTIEYNFSEEFYKNSKLYYKDKTNSKKKDLKTVSKLLLSEVIGLFIYQIRNPNKVLLPRHITTKFNYNLYTGFSVSNLYVERFLSDLVNKGIISHNFKSRFIRDIFVMTLNLIPTFLYNKQKSNIYTNSNITEYDIQKLNFYLKGLPLQFKFREYNNEQEFIDNLINDFLRVFSNNISITELSEILVTKKQFLNIIYVDNKNYYFYMFKEKLNINDPPELQLE